MPTQASINLAEQAYQNILQRPGTTAEIDYWAAQLDTGPLTLTDVASEIANSPEAQTNVAPIVLFYAAFLGRTPDAPGLNYWVNAYRDGMTLSQIAMGFEQSAQFQASHTLDLAPAALVQELAYNIVELSPAGLQYWTGYATQFLATHATDANVNDELAASLVLGFAESTAFSAGMAPHITIWLADVGEVGIYTTSDSENLVNLVSPNTPTGPLASESTIQLLYETILLRPGSASEVDNWFEPSQAIASALASSTEAQTEVTPIVQLYQGFLDRTPDAAELSAGVAAFRGGETLYQIGLGIQQTAEFQQDYAATLTSTAFITDLFQNILGRAPDPAGLQYWTSYAAQFTAAHATDANVTAELETTLVTAFVSSQEFLAKAAPYDTAWLAAVGQIGGSYASSPSTGGTIVGPQIINATGQLADAPSTGNYFLTVDNAPHTGDGIVFDNAATESWAGGSAAASQVNVATATTVAQALDVAAGHAAAASPGGLLPAATGLYDWFQWGGNTYIVEAINNGSAPAAHTALAAGDAIVELVGLVDLTQATVTGHTLIV